jgi:P-type Cu+ transporter
MKKREYKVEGMYCPACVKHVNKAVSRIPNVISSDVSLLSNALVVTFSDDTNHDEEIASALHKAGYSAYPLSDLTYKERRVKRAKEHKRELINLIVSLLLLLILMYFSMGSMWGWPIFSPFYINVVIELSLALLVMSLNYGYYYRGSIALFSFHPNMESLVSLGSLASLGFGIYGLISVIIDSSTASFWMKNLYFDSAAMIPFFTSIGGYLESLAKDKASSSLEDYLSLAPSTAFKQLKDGTYQEVSSDSLMVGDLCLVKKGNKIPSDGLVVVGTGQTSEGALTGEAIPVEKKINSPVLGGSLLLEGELIIRIEKKSSESFIGQVGELVKAASLSKTKIGLLADKISAYFTPIIMVISLITFLSWYYSSHPLLLSINMGLTVLVVSCPCALGLATPLATMVAEGKAAKESVLLKNADAVYSLSKLTSLIFDKTGTLTEGYMSVVSYDVTIKKDESSIAFLSLEKKSHHPLAEASCLYLEGLGYQSQEASEVQEEEGGLWGIVEGKKYYVGNYSYMLRKGFHPNPITNGASNSYLSSETDGVLGSISLQGKLKEGVKEEIASLEKKGYKIYLLSGDNTSAVASLAKEAGISNYEGECKPSRKNELVKQLQSQGEKVAMIGDGINDAPALESSDCGIAIGSGSNLALESASVILMQDSLESLSFILGYSKKVVANIRGNLIYAFAYNLIAIPLAAGALYYVGFSMNPMLASGLMALSSLSVVLNSLRLRHYR